MSDSAVIDSAAANPVPHADMNQFNVVDNCLQIGGQPLTDIAKAVGKIPFYAYDRSVISTQLQALRALLPCDLKLHYAVKANPMPEVVRHLAAQVDGLDVASAAELRLALETGTDPRHIELCRPWKIQ